MSDDTTKDDNLQEKLYALNISLQKEMGEAVELNTDIIQATRTMAHNLLVIRNGHLAEAERIFEMVKLLAESAATTAEMTADLVAAEWGMSLDPSNFIDLDEEDEDEDDE